MQQILTTSGVTLTTDEANYLPAMRVVATEFFGGIVVETEADATRSTVVAIIDQAVLGTTLTDADGLVYLLTDEGWYAATEDREREFLSIVPPYETIISATMPGGWSWSA